MLSPSQALIKKLDALELDIDNFQNNMGELAALSQDLVHREHFDSVRIQERQVGDLTAGSFQLLDIPVGWKKSYHL